MQGGGGLYRDLLTMFLETNNYSSSQNVVYILHKIVRNYKNYTLFSTKMFLICWQFQVDNLNTPEQYVLRVSAWKLSNHLFQNFFQAARNKVRFSLETVSIFKSKLDFLSVCQKIININASTWLLIRKLGRKKDCIIWEHCHISLQHPTVLCHWWWPKSREKNLFQYFIITKLQQNSFNLTSNNSEIPTIQRFRRVVPGLT
jgi:hypothetical protein